MTSAKGPTLAVLPGAKGETAQVLQPGGWPMPKGYANGMAADGRIVVTGDGAGAGGATGGEGRAGRDRGDSRSAALGQSRSAPPGGEDEGRHRYESVVADWGSPKYCR